jgi:hypothetical protein
VRIGDVDRARRHRQKKERTMANHHNVVTFTTREVAQELAEDDERDDVIRENEQVLRIDGDFESRAHAFRGALSTMDLIPVSPKEFWAVFGCPGRVKAETEKWVLSALEKLSAIQRGM